MSIQVSNVGAMKQVPSSALLARLRGASKAYGQVQALAAIDLDVRAGEVLAILGANGAGKSTALGLLTGRLGVDQGHVELLGGDPRDPRLAGGIIERGLLLKLRFAFDQYVNLRPTLLAPGIASPLRDPGAVDFVVMYTFPGEATVTGLHIHSGVAGVNAPVTINTGIAAGPAAVEIAAPFRGQVVRQAQVLPGDMAGVASLRGLFSNPSGYYVNMHTSVYPGGIIRGQVMAAERAVMMARLSTANEVPAVTTVTASGLGTIEAVRAYEGGRLAAGTGGRYGRDRASRTDHAADGARSYGRGRVILRA